MRRLGPLVLCCLLGLAAGEARAQFDDDPLRVFGYFQVGFQYENVLRTDARPTTSFNAQQLNVFLQKNLSRRWTAFVNVEVLNSYSSTRRWGGLNLEEVWAEYRASEAMSVRLGLQIPVFNNLNEIKNRTPLLPYIARPVVYEASFNEIFNIPAFIPERAYVQAYGFRPLGRAKVDYAAYIGNSPNVNNQPESGVTGTDSTETFLLGGRLGLRYREFKGGVSATHDRVNEFTRIHELVGGGPADYELVPRRRLGLDLSFDGPLLFAENEAIFVEYDEGTSRFDLSRFFFYTTVGVRLSERVSAYGTYWYTREHAEILDSVEDVRIWVPGVGASLSLLDAIRLKVQYAYVEIKTRPLSDALTAPDSDLEREGSIVAIAVSVLF